MIFESVVELRVEDKVATIIMSDNLNKNMFTKPIIAGLKQAFIELESLAVHAVVLHGVDNYFSTGGTFEELKSICDKKYDFVALGLHDILLKCKVPVISAMQGHALGGGFVFGCFADILLLAKQSYYSANFMNFGFTPGFGATYILPKIFGEVLGWEMLYTAEKYSGAELAARNCQCQVIERVDILRKAHEIAAQFAQIPRLSLITLKAEFVRRIQAELVPIVACELEMHKKTFHEPEVYSRIHSLLENHE